MDLSAKVVVAGRKLASEANSHGSRIGDSSDQAPGIQTARPQLVFHLLPVGKDLGPGSGCLRSGSCNHYLLIIGMMTPATQL
jgi:hypothetical protein